MGKGFRSDQTDQAVLAVRGFPGTGEEPIASPLTNFDKSFSSEEVESGSNRGATDLKQLTQAPFTR